MNLRWSVAGLLPRGPVSISGQSTWGQSGTGTDFSLSISIFPCHNHSNSATHWYSTSYCSYEKARRKKPRNLQNSLTFRIPVSIRINSVVISSLLSYGREAESRESTNKVNAISPISPLYEIKWLSSLPLLSLPSNPPVSVIILSYSHRVALAVTRSSYHGSPPNQPLTAQRATKFTQYGYCLASPLWCLEFRRGF